MLYSTLLVAATAFSSFVVAQNDSSVLPPGIGQCCSVDAGSVPDDTKQTWCQAETNTCPEVCGGIGSTKPQKCDPDTLEFTCECQNGTKPDMSLYQQSVPGLMCRYWFDSCINQTNQNREWQFGCTQARDTQCGNLTTEGESSSSSSATSSPTASSSGTGGSNQASSTAATSSSASPGAATALALAREYSTPLFAGGMAALLGLAL